METISDNNGWNHRVMVTEHKHGVYFEIHEVYYKNDIPNAYTERPISISGESVKSLKWTLKRMTECLKKPILYKGEKFPNEYKEK